MPQYLLAIDQGTTKSRAIIFDHQGRLQFQHELTLTQYFPHDGWVEQNPTEMYENTVICCHEALRKGNLLGKDITAVGITNQRETTIIWDKNTGDPIYPAIVWQDRRTSDICQHLSSLPIAAKIPEKTGLLLDPYFSATKIMWLLEHISNARTRAERGELLFGTVDTYLLWKLTNGKSHLTDASNASRTLLFNIHTQTWDKEILSALNIPEQLLPKVMDNTADFGEMDETILQHRIPITAMAGDQQAATVGQICFKAGMVKATYGTGCFMLLNTGTQVIQSKKRLLSTVAYRIENKVTYGLEGSIFSAGTTVKWLRDQLKLITHVKETETLAQSVTDAGGVYLVPAFTGLGAPYWDPFARGMITGLTSNTDRAQIVRAALESVAYQTRDLLEAMTSDGNATLNVLRVDGGMAVNNWLLQFVADILALEIQRPVCVETTALGVAFLAGLQAGVYHSLDDLIKLWQANVIFKPQMLSSQREALYRHWRVAVARTLYRKDEELY